jgi:hypothetical protein
MRKGIASQIKSPSPGLERANFKSIIAHLQAWHFSSDKTVGRRETPFYYHPKLTKEIADKQEQQANQLGKV